MLRCQVFSTTMESTLEILRDIEALFVGQNLTVEAGNVLVIRKGGDDCFLEAERDPEYGNIWQGVLDLEIEYQRTASFLSYMHGENASGRWGLTSGNGGSAEYNGDGAFAGSYGLDCAITVDASSWAKATLTESLKTLRLTMRFMLSADYTVTGVADQLFIDFPGPGLEAHMSSVESPETHKIQFRNLTGGAAFLTDPITKGQWYLIKVEYCAATGAGNNGVLRWWFEGELVYVTTSHNVSNAIAQVVLGPWGFIAGGASGHFYYDEALVCGEN